jgi:hypothetical protein
MKNELNVFEWLALARYFETVEMPLIENFHPGHYGEEYHHFVSGIQKFIEASKSMKTK